jgi:hypothetical protein
MYLYTCTQGNSTVGLSSILFSLKRPLAIFLISISSGSLGDYSTIYLYTYPQGISTVYLGLSSILYIFSGKASCYFLILSTVDPKEIILDISVYCTYTQGITEGFSSQCSKT